MKEKAKKKERKFTFAEEVSRTLLTTYRKRIWGKFTKAIKMYELIKDGDKIAVCISGGKDSFLLAKLFGELKKHGVKNFEVGYIIMNPGFDKATLDSIKKNIKLLDINATIFKTDIFKSIGEMNLRSICYMCGRMRRGNLYSKAKEMGFNKIALGHHFNDIIETSLINILYSGKVRTMLPKLKSDNFEGMELIRPLYFVEEHDIIEFWKRCGVTFASCGCPFAAQVREGGDEGKRAEVKKLIAKLKKTSPQLDLNIFRSMENIEKNSILGWHVYGTDERGTFLDDYDK
ncbi:MAG: tRNA 2-thiocytidine biosynthesis protein TtcA [Firmicutes bacterium]|nr:tRNA 2-thiocytidine biosynthesis protein TtcA [Bacillota bacterium]MCL2770842.1 tRNA 2-thiocytidine biosynthesis protein TtcA [Bacillota bacterium]